MLFKPFRYILVLRYRHRDEFYWMILIIASIYRHVWNYMELKRFWLFAWQKESSLKLLSPEIHHWGMTMAWTCGARRTSNNPFEFGYVVERSLLLAAWTWFQKAEKCNVESMVGTVDGWNPAPVDMVNFPLFTGFYTSQVVQDFFHQQYGHPTLTSVILMKIVSWRCQAWWFTMGKYDPDALPSWN